MITLIVVLVIAGLCLWLVETYIPMSPPFPVIIRVVVVLVVLLYILSFFGLINGPGVRVR